ncbi:MAG: LPS-assembly protein LptD [Rhodospirillales bacterium]|nr:MAG: LPS-assembly protein LptD [Rhodospirillales bacterium]
MAYNRHWVGALGMALVLAMNAAAAAQPIDWTDDEPIVFTADELIYDHEREMVRAVGRVQIDHGGRILLADEVTYEQPRDLMTATGNVALLEPTGEVLFSDRVEITGDLRSGLLDNIRAVLSDGARFAAVGAVRREGNLTEMRKAVYSPCDLCAKDPTRAPLWQVKAVRVRHDQVAREIEYRDAWLELGGIPVLYTPYLSHPDPTVTRKSGFLMPIIGTSTDLGVIVGTPFYWVIADDKDATITPIYTSDEGPVLGFEYRQAFKHGVLNFDGSGTVDSQDDIRGHVFSSFRYDISERWRGGAAFNRTSDDTYLRRYGFGGPSRTLTSRGFLERFGREGYFSANAYSFQPLEAGADPKAQPIVAPLLDYNFSAQLDPYGGRTTVDLNLASLVRREGNDTQRLSARAGWSLPLKDVIGGLYEVSATLWADGYHVNQLERPGDKTPFTGFSGRIWPQASADWRWPWLRTGERFDQMVEPVVQIAVAPIGGSSDKIPNEDSQTLEIDVDNVISANRVPGLDRVEGGTRLNYGLAWQAFTDRGQSLVAFAGQSYRFQRSSGLDEASGLSTQLSDFVASVDAAFAPWFNAGYRTRVNSQKLGFRSNEVLFGGGIEALRLRGRYLFLADEASEEFAGREELRLNLQSQFTRYWRGRAFSLYDLTEDGGLREVGLGFTYEDECFLLDGSWTRQTFRDRDLVPDNSFFIRISFKTIGESQTRF